MNILGFLRDKDIESMDAVQYYRTFLPLREVNRADNGIGAMVITPEELEGVTDAQIGGRDIYTMCRMYQVKEFDTFLSEIHRQDAVLVLDSDDDLTEDYKLVSGRGPEFKQILGVVDYVTVSTPALAKRFVQYTQRPPTVLRNHIDTDWMIATASNAKRLVDGLAMGFIGSPTHWGDWRLPSVPFANIVREFDVTPILAGIPPRYLQYAGDGSGIRLGPVPFAVYPVVLRQFDIVLCAVDSADEFNAGKSAIKALECMALGIVPICSRFRPYVELMYADAPIIVIDEDSQNGWYEAMRDLLCQDGRIEELAAAGPVWVKENRDMRTSGYKQWERFYQEIAGNQGEL